MKMKSTLQEICFRGSLQSHLNSLEKHLKFCLKDSNGLLITGGITVSNQMFLFPLFLINYVKII